MKNIFIVIFILFTTTIVFGQQKLQGTIRDAGSRKPVEGAVITVDSTRLGTVSNADGSFILNLPGNGPWKIRISHISYEYSNWSCKKNIDSKTIETEIYLSPKPYEINPVVVTSNRLLQTANEAPARIAVINSTTIENSAATNIDELLKSVPGLYVNRSWGMYSRNASVTMRGMSSSSRVLVMLDDVPLNKSGGGGVNWNLLPNSSFGRIEVMKGPASSLYGNNAMTGSVNLITKSSSDKAGAEAEIMLAQFNTYGFGFRASTNTKPKKPYLWLSVSGAQGDGYYLDPEEMRTEYSSKSNLEQYNAYLKAGYLISDSTRVETSFLASKFICGLGTTVFEPGGNFDNFTSLMGSMRYYAQKQNMSRKAIVFVNYEDYFNQSESMNSYSEYKLSVNPTKKIDAGLWTTEEHTLKNGINIIAGIDYKYAVEDGKTLYLTASDEIYFFGMHNFAAAFLQLSKPIGKKSIIINPTALSDFLAPYSGQHPSGNWQSFSPKLAWKHNFSKKLNLYASASKGFMPPTIDDMTRTGKIRKGIKIANPFLEPEVLYNIESGCLWEIGEKIVLEPSLYYSIVKNMIYQVWTGDSVEILSDGPKPMLQKRNVSEGTVAGAEIAIHYSPKNWIDIQVGYSYNNSRITKYNALDGDVNLTGLYMAEVPKNLISTDIHLKYNKFTFSIEYRYTDEIYSDDENTSIVEAFNLVNLNLGARIKNYTLSLSVNDLFDVQYIDRKGLLSPGRFFSGKISVKL